MNGNFMSGVSSEFASAQKQKEAALDKFFNTADGEAENRMPEFIIDE